MDNLYYKVLCPFSRKIRLMLGEKKIEVNYIEEKRGAHASVDFVSYNPTGEIPFLYSARGGKMGGHYPLSEWLEERQKNERPLLPEAVLERGETRRLIAWFDDLFYHDVVQPVLDEKIEKYVQLDAPTQHKPDMDVLRAARHNLTLHMHYMDRLLSQRNFLVGNTLTLADITAAAHLSCLDYTGDVAWGRAPEVKRWYSHMKSRPCFRPVLRERIPDFPPHPNYENPDF